MPDSAAEVTAAGIARLAGVGRAAVSNWRRRHADFPRPVGGTETSPSFALSDVEEWLRTQGKLAEVRCASASGSWSPATPRERSPPSSTRAAPSSSYGTGVRPGRRWPPCPTSGSRRSSRSPWRRR